MIVLHSFARAGARARGTPGRGGAACVAYSASCAAYAHAGARARGNR